MGFDLSGVNPKMNMKPEELPVYGKYSKMDFNEKWKVFDADKSMRIGVELTVMLDCGDVQEHSDTYKAELEALPQVDCYVCDNNNRGHKKKKECKPCNQTGLKDDWAKSYPFDVENVREFAKFCLESGGFEIW